MSTDRRGLLGVIGVVAVCALGVSGCSTAGRGDGQVTPVTVTVTGSTTSQASAPASPSAPVANPLARGFGAVAAQVGVPVGVALAPVGRGDSRPIMLGDNTPQVAWSTIKVPLAVAAERQNGPSTAESNAIINSDNASAEALWSSLGSDAVAARKVTAVLREGGDTQSTVPAQRLRAGFTVFGQTVWTLPAAATFTAHLPCMPGTAHVVSLMGQVAGNQQWGIEVMSTPRSTAVKGGWGPGVDGSYLVRQIGLITFSDGRQTAVAMSAAGGSMSGGIAALNAIGNWLNRNAARLPRGAC